MLSGVLRDAVGFKNFFNRAIYSAHPVEKVCFFDRDARIGLLERKFGVEKAFFRLRKNARIGLLRSEIALNWPNN